MIRCRSNHLIKASTQKLFQIWTVWRKIVVSRNDQGRVNDAETVTVWKQRRQISAFEGHCHGRHLGSSRCWVNRLRRIHQAVMILAIREIPALILRQSYSSPRRLKKKPLAPCICVVIIKSFCNFAVFRHLCALEIITMFHNQFCILFEVADLRLGRLR